MTRICVLSHSCQHSAQIRASMSAPSEPGSPTLPAPSRSWPHRAQTTIATRSSYKRVSPKPADPADRRVSEKRAGDHVLHRDRAERPAVGALFGAIAEDGATPVVDRGDPFQHQIFRVARVPYEHDLPHPWGTRELGHDDPVARRERGLHAPARHGDAMKQG